MTSRSALVVASGAATDVLAKVSPADLTIAADGGLDAANAAGLDVDLVVGDFDSVSAKALSTAESAGIEISRHPVDKDESDLELAMKAAIDAGATSITAVLQDGGRLDHQLANILVLGSPRWASVVIDAWVDATRLWVIHRRRELPLEVGDHLSLHAVGGSALEVTTEGLRYELVGETLESLTARGIANEVMVPCPVIVVGTGTVVAISSPRPTSGPDVVR